MSTPFPVCMALDPHFTPFWWIMDMAHTEWQLRPLCLSQAMSCVDGRTAKQVSGNVWNSLPWRVVTTNGYTGGDGGDDDGGGAASLDGSMCRGAGPRHEYYWEVEFVAIASKNLSVGVLDCGDTVETAVARCTAASTTHVHSNGAFNGSPMLEFGSSKVYFGNTRARPIALPNGGNLVGWRLGLLLDLNENSEACGTLSAVFVRYEDLASGAAVTPAETLELGVVASGLCSRLYRPVVSIHHVNNCVRVVSRRLKDAMRVWGRTVDERNAVVGGVHMDVSAVSTALTSIVYPVPGHIHDPRWRGIWCIRPL